MWRHLGVWLGRQKALGRADERSIEGFLRAALIAFLCPDTRSGALIGVHQQPIPACESDVLTL